MAIVLTRLVFQEVSVVLERDDYATPEKRDPPERVVAYYFRDADNPRLRGEGALRTKLDIDEPHAAMVDRVSKEIVEHEAGAQVTEADRLKGALASVDAIAPEPMPVVIGGKA